MLSAKNNVWYCTNCSMYNAFNKRCRGCKDSLVQTIELDWWVCKDSLVQTRELDCWACKDCRRYQYITKSRCLDCNQPRSNVDTKLIELRMNKLRESIPTKSFKKVVPTAPKNKKVKNTIPTWTCEICTFINEKQFNSCMMCSGVKQAKKEVNENECKICMSNKIDSVIVHKNSKTAHSACFECATIIKKKNGLCPFCKQDIKMIVKVYNS